MAPLAVMVDARLTRPMRRMLKYCILRMYDGDLNQSNVINDAFLMN
jgi:hypothetical protein